MLVSTFRDNLCDAHQHPVRLSSDASPQHTIAVTMVLEQADKNLSAAEIARQYKDTKKIEPKVAFNLRALARIGELLSDDGGNTLTLKRAA